MSQALISIKLHAPKSKYIIIHFCFFKLKAWATWSVLKYVNYKIHVLKQYNKHKRRHIPFYSRSLKSVKKPSACRWHSLWRGDAKNHGKTYHLLMLRWHLNILELVKWKKWKTYWSLILNTRFEHLSTCLSELSVKVSSLQWN